jgi:hypothetical protein
MKLRLMRQLFLACSVIAAAGCLNLEQEIAILPDGSGSFILHYAVSEQAIIQMQAMERLKQQLAAINGDAPAPTGIGDLMPLFRDTSAADIHQICAPYKANGIEVVNVDVESRGRWQHVHVEGTFRSLADLAKADFFPEYGFSLFKTKEGHYAFHRAGRQLDQLPGPADAETIQMLAPLMAGFSVRLKVQTPTPILKTNAPRKSRNEAEWAFDFNRDPNVLTTLQISPLTIVFDGRGLSLPEIRLPTETAGEG